MAIELERLIVQLSADLRRYERDMAKARGVSNREFNRIERRAKRFDRTISNVGRGVRRSLIGPLAGIAGVLGTREIIRYADAWTVAENKIKAAGQIAGREGRSLEGIIEIADRSRGPLNATADLYAKLLRATKDVADSEEDVARATEIVNKAFKAGGAAASEQAAGILQLAQALGSGFLQGDELRSIRENAPLIAQAIADEFDTTIAGLKELGSSGELEVGRVFKAILKAQPQIEQAFSKTNSTIADGFTRIQNAFTQYVGTSDDSLDATERLVAALNFLADNFETTADVALKFAGIIAAGLLGRSIGRMIAQLGLGAGAL
ncbi:MAG: tape measure protein, partial [Alphaproteobacteria bacterium]|nr:tape measure protein [Alphaproteobacteria bacterium]